MKIIIPPGKHEIVIKLDGQAEVEVVTEGMRNAPDKNEPEVNTNQEDVGDRNA